MTEQSYPETGITQETRNMYSDKLGKAFNEIIDEIMKPVRPIDRLEDHSILLDELTIMYDAHMTIGGEQNRFNASVLRAAINLIISCTK